MTTSTDVFHNSRATGLSAQERQDRAIKAVSAFRKLQPTLTAFARVLTKNPKVKVVMDAGSPRTNGSTIYYRPPIELGMDWKHDRSLCDKRGDDLILLCKACAAREATLVTIYHEISHITFDSFDPPTDEQKREIITHGIKLVDKRYGEAIAARIAAAPYWIKDSYRGMASLVSEFLPVIVNALEDVRVNREMFTSRPGTKVMFEAWANDAFSNGVEQADGEVVLWRDYPADAQACVGLFAKAAGYDYTNWFHPAVVEALNDSELTGLVNQMGNIRGPGGVYELSFPILHRLKALGFCVEAHDPQPEPEPEPEPEENDEQSDDTPESEPEDEAGTDPEGDPSDDSDGADESDGDASEPSAGDSDGADAEPGDDDGNGDSSSEDEAASDDAGTASGDDAGESEGDSEEELGDEAGEAGADDRGDREDSGSEPDGDPSPGTGEPGDSATGASQPDAGDTEGGEDEGDEGDVDQAGDGSASDAGLPGGDRAEPVADVPEAEGDAEGSVADADGDTPEPTEDGTPDDGPGDGAPIDTGADTGEGGVDLTDLPEPGTAADAIQALKVFGDHDEVAVTVAELENQQAIDVAIIQGTYFETPSVNVGGVRIHRYESFDDEAEGWAHKRFKLYGMTDREVGVSADLAIPEQVLAPCLMRMRVAFADNARANQAHNLRSGKVRSRVLGRRAWADDDRLFQKKTVPGKKDYFVVIGIDISGSTAGMNIVLAKRAAMAQAELLHRAGIKFAVYAHTADRVNGQHGLSLEMYEVKGADEVWTDKQRAALANLGPVSGNIDGHTLEFYRKRMDESTATHKICLYYTDGKMPATNHDEELEILQREIATCKRLDYTLLGVGIRTDSPTRHGLDTVQVDDDSDLIKVVRHLEKRMT